MHTLTRSNFLKSLAISTVALIVVHCGVESEKSRQSHVIGQTSYPRPGALESCRSKVSTEHPIVRDYLQKIVDRIIEKNPNTFRGPYSPTAFCVQLLTNDPMLGKTNPNASAQPQSGLLTFNVPVIKEISNDASLAAVVAHELAHVTMDHSRSEPDILKNSSEIQRLKAEGTRLYKEKDELLKTSLPKFQAVYQKLTTALEDPSLKQLKQQVQTNLSYYITSIKTSEDKLAAKTAEAWVEQSLSYDYEYYFNDFVGLAQPYSQLPMLMTVLAEVKVIRDPIIANEAKIDTNRKTERDLSDRLLGGKDASYNWREQEADEVGYELYLRAEFSSSLYTWIHNYYLRQKSIPSEAACESMLEKGQIPDRGRASHPASCWRIYDIKFLESGQHLKDYEALLPKATQTELFPGELDKVKAYLQTLP